MKVLFLTNIPSPYRVDFFNELGKYCDLTVLCERKSSKERDESWKKLNIKNFKLITLKGLKIGVAEAICPTVIKYLDRSYDHIIVTNFSDLTGIIAITYMKIEHIKYEIESDGGFAGTGKGIKENLKHWLLKDANKFYSTGKEHDLYYLMYGAKKENIVRYPFSSIHERDILEKELSEIDKNTLKKELNIKEEKIILAVGQFVHRKGYDILLKACTNFDTNIGIYIIGGDPTEEYLNIVNTNNLTNIHFLKFKEKKELEKYYLVSDVFVHPTREDIWGLVVNEAVAKGLPVITTNKCIAGMELITDGLNGMIIPSDNVVALNKAIKLFLYKNCFAYSISIAKKYTIENMVKEHLRNW